MLLVIFKPFHSWLRQRIPRWPRLAALLTTILILLVVLLPLGILGWNAYQEFHELLARPMAAANVDTITRPATPTTVDTDATDDTAIVEKKDEKILSAKLKSLVNDLVTDLDFTTWRMDDDTATRIVSWATAFAGNFVITGVKSVIGILVGLLIMVISLYYFLADGPAMIRAMMRLSPLDSRYEQELLERFGQVSRAVVLATLLSAFVQGVLAGIGYYFALPNEAPVFLLTAATMVTAMIPFFGAAAMWICVCGWVYLYGKLTTAVILAIYCAIVVSGIDNIIKPLVLHGQSNLHPLLALLSILGGVTVLGPVGIIVGPMAVSFLQALLNMLRKELELFGDPDSEASKQLAEVAAGAAHIVSDSGETVEDELAPGNLAARPDKTSRASKLMRFRRKKGKR